MTSEDTAKINNAIDNIIQKLTAIIGNCELRCRNTQIYYDLVDDVNVLREYLKIEV